MLLAQRCVTFEDLECSAQVQFCSTNLDFSVSILLVLAVISFIYIMWGKWPVHSSTFTCSTCGFGTTWGASKWFFEWTMPLSLNVL